MILTENNLQRLCRVRLHGLGYGSKLPCLFDVLRLYSLLRRFRTMPTPLPICRGLVQSPPLACGYLALRYPRNERDVEPGLRFDSESWQDKRNECGTTMLSTSTPWDP